MSDIVDGYRALKAIRKQEGNERAAKAVSQACEAAALAKTNGMRLIRRDNIHYQLIGGSPAWLINLYPSNGRIYADPKRAKAPFLNVPDEWTLSDAVNAAIEVTKKARP